MKIELSRQFLKEIEKTAEKVRKENKEELPIESNSYILLKMWF